MFEQFFTVGLSKSVSVLFDPTIHWLILVVFLFLLVLFDRKGAVKIVFGLALYISMVVVTPLAREMFLHLEKQYPPISLEESISPKAVVVLTGGVVFFNLRTKQFSWSEEAERILEPLRNLVKSDTLLIISGAEFYPARNGFKGLTGEARSMAEIARLMGVPTENIILEESAKSTLENAIEVKKILNTRQIKDFYLVTSAYHMPRSIQSFEAIDLSPIAYSVNFQVLGRELELFSYRGTKNVLLFKKALHEYIGSLYYWFLSLGIESED